MDLTWENYDELGQDDDVDHDSFTKAWNTLCANSKSDDFYFDVTDEMGELSISVTPKAYTDKCGAWFDEHLDIEHIMPPYAQEQLMEATFGVEVDKSKQEIIDDMTALGFIHKVTVFSEVVVDDQPVEETKKDCKNCDNCKCPSKVEKIQEVLPEVVDLPEVKPEVPKLVVQDLLGMTEEAALERIKLCKFKSRLFARDDNWFEISHDHSDYRINLVIKKGLVTKALVG